MVCLDTPVMTFRSFLFSNVFVRFEERDQAQKDTSLVSEYLLPTVKEKKQPNMRFQELEIWILMECWRRLNDHHHISTMENEIDYIL